MTFITRFLSLCCILFLSTPLYPEPQNIGLLRKKLTHYHDSGRYALELKKQVQAARQYLLEQVQQNKNKNHPKPLALVLDIDETSLSNYSKMVKRGFFSDTKNIHQEILNADSPVILPMLALYKEAQQQGISVFFVTGRDESERYATIKNLHHAGYSNWSGLYLRPHPYTYQSISPFKSQARANISKKGYTVIATIGDQYSDIKGGYAQKGFKLPNPFYYLP